MRQMLQNAESPVDWTGWPKHDVSWVLINKEFVGFCDGSTFYIGQSIAGLKLGDVLTLRYNITQSSMDGSLVLSDAGAIGGVALNETVALHEIELTVTNATPTYDFYMAVTGGATGTITIDYMELWKNGEMVVNFEGTPSAWGW